MKIGKLNKRVFFQKPVIEPDGYGGEKVSYQDVFEAWAYIEPLRDYEKYLHAQLQSGATHRVVIRYREDLTKEMRIIFRGRIYKIESIIEENFEKRFLILEVSQ